MASRSCCSMRRALRYQRSKVRQYSKPAALAARSIARLILSPRGQGSASSCRASEISVESASQDFWERSQWPCGTLPVMTRGLPWRMRCGRTPPRLRRRGGTRGGAVFAAGGGQCSGPPVSHCFDGIGHMHYAIGKKLPHAGHNAPPQSSAGLWVAAGWRHERRLRARRSCAFPRASSARRQEIIRKEVVGGHCALRRNLDPASQCQRRDRATAPKPADRGAVNLCQFGHVVVVELCGGHPIGELHARRCTPHTQSAQPSLCTAEHGRPSQRRAPYAHV